MLIKGYDHGPLTAGEPLTDRPGFWTNHLLGWCEAGPDGGRPEPEWFGDDGADADALTEVLHNERAWPVFRVPFGDGHCAVVVYRNLDGDPGLDFLLTHPGWARAEELSSYNGDWYGSGPNWRELAHVAADVPRSGAVPGVFDPAARLLLLLPFLVDGDRHVAEAGPGIADALVGIGAPEGTAALAAGCLVRGLRPDAWHDPAWGSPLSGGDAPPPVDTALRESPLLRNAGVTVTQWKRLARALGGHGESTGVTA
ncbi:hypothetical protein ABZ479_13935 [Streptomyces sp. NPDC005722]